MYSITAYCSMLTGNCEDPIKILNCSVNDLPKTLDILKSLENTTKDCIDKVVVNDTIFYSVQT